MKILIVDDDYGVAEGLGFILSYHNYNADVALDSKTAFYKLNESSYDLVITDGELPDINGLKLTKMIKKRYPLILIIFCSAWGEKAKRKALKAGADLYISKPYEPRDLVEKINTIALSPEKFLKLRKFPHPLIASFSYYIRVLDKRFKKFLRL